MTKTLDKLDKKLKQVEKARGKALRAFRLRCKHLHLAEESGLPPHRICVDCGAIEQGWYCGYQVLCLPSERTDKQPPRKIVNILYCGERQVLKVLKQDWPPYPVGQSHDNFDKGCWDYKSLTAIKC
jgi:hypothetical protein